MAKDLVKTGEQIELEFGIPIVNKRISVTPIALVGAQACKSPEDFVTIAKTLDRAAEATGVNFLGGYSALVSKGMTKADEYLIRSIPQALAETERICSSVNIGSTKTGINMDAVRLMGEIVKETAEKTADRDSLGCAKLVVFCNAPDDNPFMAGAFHGVTEGLKALCYVEGQTYIAGGYREHCSLQICSAGKEPGKTGCGGESCYDRDGKTIHHPFNYGHTLKEPHSC